MAKYEMNLPESHTVTKGPRDKSWTASVTVDVTKITSDIIGRLAIHGLHQKVADAAAGASNEAEAIASMQKAVDAILAGEWSSRVAGSGVDETTRVQRAVMRSAMKAKLGSKSPEWTAFTGLDDAAQAEKLDALFAKNADKLQGAVDAKLAELAAERERRKGLADAVTIDL